MVLVLTSYEVGETRPTGPTGYVDALMLAHLCIYCQIVIEITSHEIFKHAIHTLCIISYCLLRCFYCFGFIEFDFACGEPRLSWHYSPAFNHMLDISISCTSVTELNVLKKF